MDAIRKQLDVLMGANRNGDVTEVDRKYSDRDVCRLFLAGLCPHDLFQLTKMDLGPCPKVHSLQLRKDYEEAKANGMHNFDRDLEDLIERLIVECERKIQRALKRLESEDAKAAIAISVSEVTQTPEVLELSKQIKEKLKEVDTFDLEGKSDNKIRAQEALEELRGKRADKQAMLLLDAFNIDRASLPQPHQIHPPLAPTPSPNPPDPRTQEMINEKLKTAEDLGEQGLIDEAQKALEEAEALKKLSTRQEPSMDSSRYTAADVRITDQKLRVCDICGAFLSVYDSDRRLADHFGGKLHLGYMQIREKLTELQVLVMFDHSSIKKFSYIWHQKKETSLERESDLRTMTRESGLRIEGPRSMVGMTKVIAEKEGPNMIGVVGSMIGMTEIGAITVTVKGILLDLAIVSSAAGKDRVPVLLNVQGIMSDTGAMIDTEALAQCR